MLPTLIVVLDPNRQAKSFAALGTHYHDGVKKRDTSERILSPLK